MNRGVKGLGIAVIVVGAAAIGAPIALQGIVKDAMARRIAAATGVPTEIGAARLAVLPQPHVEASDIRLGSSPSGGAMSGTIAALRFNLSLGTLLGGPVEVSDIAVDRPALTIRRAGVPAAGSGAPTPAGLSLDGLAVNDGSFSYIDDRRQARFDITHLSFNMKAPGAGAPLDLAGTAEVAGKPVDWRLSVEAPDALTTGRATAATAEVGAKGSLDSAVLRGHVRIAAGHIEIPDMAASAGATSLSGSGRVDLAGDTPMLTAALKARRLDVGARPSAGAPGVVLPADRSALRLADAAVALDIDEADVGPLRATALRGKITLTDGLLRLGLLDATLYGGTLHGDASIDAAQPLPHPTLHATLSHLDIAPLLAGIPGQARFSGRLDADMSLNSSGSSLDEVVPNLAGSARLGVHDAAITGIDVPAIIRSVASYLPPAWQRMTNRIDIQAMTASFQLAQGVAATSDIHAVSPVVELSGKGDVDLNAESFDLSFDPKIVTVLAPPGTRPAPATGALGIAILVQGPWAAPRLSADISNAMRNPQQTLDTLQTLGQQMLGGDSATGGAIQPQDIIKGLGGLFGGMKEGRQSSAQPRPGRDGDAMSRQLHDLFNAP